DQGGGIRQPAGTNPGAGKCAEQLVGTVRDEHCGERNAQYGESEPLQQLLLSRSVAPIVPPVVGGGSIKLSVFLSAFTPIPASSYGGIVHRTDGVPAVPVTIDPCRPPCPRRFAFWPASAGL